MSYVAGDYVIITLTGRRALVLHDDGKGLLVKPMTRNSKGYGKQIDTPEVYMRYDQVSPDTYGEKP